MDHSPVNIIKVGNAFTLTQFASKCVYVHGSDMSGGNNRLKKLQLVIVVCAFFV